MKLRAGTGRALLSTIFLFGLLTWLYVIAVQLTHPDWIDEELTHINIFPFNLRVDITGIVAFVASALAFFLLRLKPARGRRK
jgi:heme/copper-type cytochrome/quinol oxidase subunit 3